MFSAPNQGLFIYPFPASSVDTGETVLNCFQANGNGANIKATLVWTDKEATPSSGHILVNDLDLVIVDQSSVAHRTKTEDGNFDSFNNVEQVELQGLIAGSVVAVHVFGHNVPVGPSAYALVVTGNVSYASCPTDFLVGNSTTCPNSCSGQGTCEGLLCTCNSGRYGLDCSLVKCPSTSQGEPCGGNGNCNTETGVCSCNLNYASPDCVAILPPPIEVNGTTAPIQIPPNKSPYTGGLLAGLVIAAFFLGAIVSVFLGGYLAVRYLEYRRERVRKDRTTKDEEMN